ncbi:DUF3348 family protein [Spongiibacter sp. KMU-158]|uniref:DUF3348 family protein n=1 Tax=Spongiibacter pelagi TaxID=2760804 RepID=A0A927C124_9GAMM|nr:DUF3348 family protein [Spongiibacter pelagi]MBD2858233.1 DUF3348 family protein [Spongiibacter pelagi]
MTESTPAKSSAARPVATASATGTRLTRLLVDLSVGSVELSHRNFVEKLAGLVDLSEAISLSERLRGLSRQGVIPQESESSPDLKELFLQRRQERVAFIGRSFNSQDEDMPFILPTLRQEMLTKPAESFEPFQRFYALHQSEMEFQILKLRGEVRRQISAHSERLARLAVLDSAIGDTLAENHRRVFAQIPRLLARRFVRLAGDYQVKEENVSDMDSWTAVGGWLDCFYKEMMSLLLAELEVRLLPVLGLVEAQEIED